jgi:chromate transport protein ChrA
VPIVFAQNTPPAASTTETTIAPTIPNIATLPGPNSNNKLEETNTYLTSNLLPHIARIVTGLAITLSVIFIIFGAIQFLTAYGNDEKLGNAKKGITFAIIGLIISLLSFSIVQIIFFTGFQVTQIK